MRQRRPYIRLRNQALSAISRGASRSSICRVSFDTSSNCQRPHFIEAFERSLDFWKSGVPIPVGLDHWMRCRGCPACLRARAWAWERRAKSECLLASRTWFCTFTLRPEEQYRALCAADLGEDPGPSEEFRGRHSVISQEFTRYFKRVRWEVKGSLRYLLVCEAHKSGLPHYHALVHEPHEGPQVPHKVLRSQWKLGFSRFQLVDNTAVGSYVAKYLSKSTMARVRASVDYGLGMKNDNGLRPRA